MRRPRTWAPLYAVLLVAGLAVLSVALGLRPNLSPSLPVGLYRLSSAKVQRGSLVAACLPPDVAKRARHDGLLRAGTCPGGAAPLLKLVGAVGGDIVAVTAQEVLVNGVSLQAPAPRLDGTGRVVHPLPPGAYRLGLRQLWLYTPHPLSWDSRFFGPVTHSSLLSSVEPVWTVGPVPKPSARSSVTHRGPSP